MITKQLEKDLQHTFDSLTPEEISRLLNSSIVITGCAGFLGFYLVHFLYQYRERLKLKQVICLDNFMLGRPKWLDKIATDERFMVKKFDIIKDQIQDVGEADKVDYIVHMASIASPVFYRKYPIQTLDANIWGAERAVGIL